MQINQRGDLGARRADLHAGAGGRIQHPGRQNDHAGRRLNVNNPATGTLLTVLLSNMAPIQRMPAEMHPDLLPDMGRMNRRLGSGGKSLVRWKQWGRRPLGDRLHAGGNRQTRRR